jgi:putative glutamine amidotransferase
MQRLDGLLVTGSGSDLAPQFYGERQQYPFQRMSDERAQLELGLSKLAFEHHVPTFGICGGMQSMNVALGGTLIQDIPGQIPTKIQHLPKKSAEKTAHLVHIEPKTLLRRIIKKSSIPVNSSHHQSVKTIPSSLNVSAVAPDGVIETTILFGWGCSGIQSFSTAKTFFKSDCFRLLSKLLVSMPVAKG